MAGPLPEMQPFSMGNVIQTAEAIKGMRRQAESDKLRDAYMGQRMQQDQNQETRAQGQYDAEKAAHDARLKYLQTDAILRSPDPVAAVRQYAPDMVAEIERAQGPGSFDRIPPEALLQHLQQIAPQLAARAGIELQQPAGFTLSEGQTRFGADGKPLASVAPKPQKTPARFRPMSAQEIAGAGLPPGTAAQVNDDSGQIQVLSKRDASATLSQKDATAAKQKLMTVQLARQQLNAIRQRFGAIKGGLSAGPAGQGYLPTEGGKSFDAAVDQMRSTLTALTRTPGVGAMSDYETRLDQAKFPSRQNYETVTQQQIDAIDNQLNLIESGYTNLLGGTQPTEEAPPEPDLSTLSNEDLLKALNGG